MLKLGDITCFSNNSTNNNNNFNFNFNNNNSNNNKNFNNNNFNNSLIFSSEFAAETCSVHPPHVQQPSDHLVPISNNKSDVEWFQKASSF